MRVGNISVDSPLAPRRRPTSLSRRHQLLAATTLWRCATSSRSVIGAARQLDESTWQDMIDVNLTGVWHTTKAAVPHLIEGGRGGSMILTSSTAGLKAFPNFAHDVAAKHGVVGLMRTLALELAPHMIRVNSVHPTSVNTDMVHNDATYRLFAPDIEYPTGEQVAPRFGEMNALPINLVEARDISNAVLFLASDEARYITGVTMPVDAGALVK
jgi:(+)-trans-carveol dehydrogenase